MAYQEMDTELRTAAPVWTRRALTGLLAGAGIPWVIGEDSEAKKKKPTTPKICTRNCGNRVCGSDGCGGSCGNCDAGFSCEEGQCLATSAYVFDTAWGSYGTSGESKFNLPWGIAVDDSAKVYVADSGNDRIQKFSSTGEFLLEWGQHGDEDLEFHEPAGIAA